MSRTHIRSQDVRGLLRLLGEVEDLARDPPAAYAHAADGILRLVGADASAITPVADFRPGGAASLERLVVRGFPPDIERMFFHDGLRGTALSDPAGPVFVASYVPGTISTHFRRDILCDARWEASAYGDAMTHVAGVGDAIYSIAPREAGSQVTGLGVYRGRTSSRFGAAERDIVQIFQEELSRLQRKLARRAAPRAAAEAAARLRPRWRATLRLVLAGLAEKEIARVLGISGPTAHEYVCALYRHYRVGTRAELLALFIEPDVVPE